MTKKIISVLAAGVIAATACSSMNASAAVFYDNQESPHNYHSAGSKYYSDPYEYFKDQFGWGENRETVQIYKNNKHVSNLFCYYNPELFTDDSAQTWVGTANNATGFYIDGWLKCETTSWIGQQFHFTNTRYCGGFWKSVNHLQGGVNSHTAVSYHGDIYWD